MRRPQSAEPEESRARSRRQRAGGQVHGTPIAVATEAIDVASTRAELQAAHLATEQLRTQLLQARAEIASELAPIFGIG